MTYIVERTSQVRIRVEFLQPSTSTFSYRALYIEVVLKNLRDPSYDQLPPLACAGRYSQVLEYR